MKTLVLILGLICIGFTSNAQGNIGATVTVTIENVLTNEGTILASLRTADTFIKGPGIINVTQPAKAGEVTLVFENVVPDTYAIMVIHDANDNKRMDMEANGMPKESYGMTGNDMTMGPPTFEGAKFDVSSENLEFRIRF